MRCTNPFCLPQRCLSRVRDGHGGRIGQLRPVAAGAAGTGFGADLLGRACKRSRVGSVSWSRLERVTPAAAALLQTLGMVRTWPVLIALELVMALTSAMNPNSEPCP